VRSRHSEPALPLQSRRAIAAQPRGRRLRRPDEILRRSDLPNFSKTGPIVYHEGLHAVQARTAVALLDALHIRRAHFAGNSQGGQSSSA
jgi:pimeloyl-ACP methyl ester carboxylesterase